MSAPAAEGESKPKSTPFFRALTSSGSGRKKPGSLRGRSGTLADAASPFRGAYLSFRDVSCTIEGKQVLRSVSGCAKPGTILSVLGHSGSGRTVLLDILAGVRRNGPSCAVSGEILLNGRVCDPYSFSRIAGYVTQVPQFTPTLTVRESIRFSALLRLPQTIPLAEKFARVEATLRELNLVECADSYIGSPLMTGLERKSVAIGIESVLSRALLFFDEPTSGLSQADAYNIVQTLRKFVQTGVTVVLSVTQPNLEIYNMFDSLLLLSSGQSIYYGARLGALNYFEALDIRCPPAREPGPFLEEVSLNPTKYAGPYALEVNLKDSQLDLARTYRNSTQHRQCAPSWESPPKNLENISERYTNLYPTSPLFQLFVCAHRALRTAFRDPAFYRTRCLRSIILAITLGTLFFGLGNNQQDGNLRVPLFFFIVSWAGLGSRPSLIPLYEERRVFYFQRASGFYRTTPYVIATFLAEIPLCIIETFFFIFITYFMCQFVQESGRFGYSLVMIVGIKLASNAFCRLLMALLPTRQKATNLAGTFLGVWLLVCGYLVPRDSFNDSWYWMYWISFLRYGLEGLCINELNTLVFTCDDDELVPPEDWPGYQFAERICPRQTGTDYLDDYDMAHDDAQKWFCLGIVWLFYFIFAFLTWAALKLARPDLKPVPKPKLGKLFSGHRFRREERRSSVFHKRYDTYNTKLIDAVSPSGRPSPTPSALSASNNMAALPVNATASDHAGGAGDDDASASTPLLSYPLNTARAVRRRAVTNHNIRVAAPYVSFNRMSVTITYPDHLAGLTEARHRLASRQYVLTNSRIKLKRTILHEICGYVNPGMLLAVMGPSGSGKRTLLRALADRVPDAEIQGEVLVNGKRRDRFFERIAGYCMEDDPHLPTQTVREAVTFSALLRLPPTYSVQRKVMEVDDTLNELGLHFVEDKLLDDLSREDMKLVAIATELVADPDVLFIENPTQGLSPSSANNVLRVIRHVAENGRAVMCTPKMINSDTAQYFNWMLLLDQTGNQIYFGPTGDKCSIVLEYFAKLGAKCPEHKNPMDFLLEVAGSGAGAEKYSKVNAAEQYATSSIAKDVAWELHRAGAKGPSSKRKGNNPVVVETKRDLYPANFWLQTHELVRREVISYYRRPELRTQGVVRVVAQALFLGSLYYQMGNDQISARNRVACLFLAIVLSILDVTGSLSLIVQDRCIYFRERAAKMYAPLPYFIGILFVELPHTIFVSTIFSSVVYYMSGLDDTDGGEKFLVFWLTMFTVRCVAVSMTHLIAVVAKTEEVAMWATPILTTTFILFSGFLIQESDIPDGWLFAYYASPIRAALATVVTNEFLGVSFDCPDGDGAIPIPIPGDRYRDYCPLRFGRIFLIAYSFPDEDEDKWDVYAELWGFVGGFCILLYLALKFTKRVTPYKASMGESL